MTIPAHRPTQMQKEALRLASIDELRYYKGGWYSVPQALGDWQHAPAVGGASIPSQTIKACVAAEWLSDNCSHDIYERRWAITQLGRDILASLS